MTTPHTKWTRKRSGLSIWYEAGIYTIHHIRSKWRLYRNGEQIGEFCTLREAKGHAW